MGNKKNPTKTVLLEGGDRVTAMTVSAALRGRR